MNNSTKSDAPKTISTKDMFCCMLASQNHTDTKEADTLFKKRFMGGTLFDGHFEFDDYDGNIRVAFMSKLKANCMVCQMNRTIDDEDELTGYALQATIDGVINIIRDYTIKGYKVVIGDAKIKYKKLFNGKYTMNIDIPFIADNEVNY